MTPEDRADAIAHAVMRSVIIEGRKLTFEDVAMRVDALSHLRAAIAEEREACAKLADDYRVLCPIFGVMAETIAAAIRARDAL